MQGKFVFKTFNDAQGSKIRRVLDVGETFWRVCPRSVRNELSGSASDGVLAFCIMFYSESSSVL